MRHVCSPDLCNRGAEGCSNQEAMSQEASIPVQCSLPYCMSCLLVLCPCLLACGPHRPHHPLQCREYQLGQNCRDCYPNLPAADEPSEMLPVMSRRSFMIVSHFHAM